MIIKVIQSNLYKAVILGNDLLNVGLLQVDRFRNLRVNIQGNEDSERVKYLYLTTNWPQTVCSLLGPKERKWKQTCQVSRTIQYNSLVTLPWWGFSVTMRLKKKKKLIKITEVVNNTIKRKECGEQSNINIPI